MRFLAALLVGLFGTTVAVPQSGTLLSRGRTVLFSPGPNYSLTRQGNTDPRDLTDGRLSQRPDHKIWFDPLAVGWSYAGRVSLALDLGRPARIQEIAIRLLGGSPQHQISFPGWVEAFVSADGEHYVKVAEFSRWNPGDFQRFGVPEDIGRAWVHLLRFRGLNVYGRWVGLRLYGTGLTCSDELYVYGSFLSQPRPPAGSPSGFTVRHPGLHFHKPALTVIRELPAPIPLGVTLPGSLGTSEQLTIELDFPAEIRLDGGYAGAVDLASLRPVKLPDGFRRYAFTATVTATNKAWGRLFVSAPNVSAGWQGKIRYRFRHQAWQSPRLEVPVTVLSVPAVTPPQKLLTCLGWWTARESMRWPNVLAAWRHLGLNGFPVFSYWLPSSRTAPEWQLLNQARSQGFFIVNIDSPFHRLLARRKNEPEIYCQYFTGGTGTQLCPSYRGRYYWEEIQRLARECAAVRPHFLALDIELWSWRGPVQSRNCWRCWDDLFHFGLTWGPAVLNWTAWEQQKGYEMWRDLVTEAQRAAGGRMDVGGYDFRPGMSYQKTWPFDRLYPSLLQSSQVSTYSCLYPYHLEAIGDEVRRDRSRLPKSDVLPWITPGDAGTFPGEAFRWALYECFLNGARGIYFWSGRLWDAENLAAFAEVIRVLRPVEPLILQGSLVGNRAVATPPGRVSGIARGDDMVLLVADYRRKTRGTVKVALTTSQPVTVKDLATGATIGTHSGSGTWTLAVPLEGQRARVLRVERSTDDSPR